MSPPSLWPTDASFYPYGDTSPLCYTQDLVDGEPASVLLLGCGDPMSILDTVYANTTDSQCSRNLDFTCCDREGGVLARNLILLTLLVEENVHEQLPSLWNIFFDFFINKSCLSLLVAQCERLLDASRTMETWSTSPYHRYISFCDANSLSVVRRYWQLYLQTAALTSEEAKRLKDKFTSDMKDAQTPQGWFNYSPIRSAGPLASFAMRTILRGFRRYWDTGVMSHDPETIARAHYVNPTFVHSRAGDKFSIHKGLYPLTCFFLVDAFATLNVVEPGLAQKETQVQDICVLNAVVPVAQKQFSTWCTAFARVVHQQTPHTYITASHSHSPVFLRFFCGDALELCRALRYYRDKKELSTPFVTAPCSATRITFDALSSPSMPTSFDVIDTSNLTDHLGLLNVLTHATQLLKHSSFSILYTETLSPHRDSQRGNGDVVASTLRGLLERACCDLGTLSLLLGVVPTTYVSGFGMLPPGFEMMAHRMMRVPLSQYHQRLVWRRPMPGTTIVESGTGWKYRVEFVPEELAGVLCGVYRKMFVDEEEDVSEGMERLSVSGGHAAGSAEEGRPFSDPATIHYTQRSYAELVAAVRDHLCTSTPNSDDTEANWRRTMNTLFDLLRGEERTLPVGGQRHFQDLCAQLHLLGLHTADVMQYSVINEASQTRGVLRGWRTIPATVSVVLVVPRQRIQEVKTLLDELGTPRLRCEVFGSTTSQVFASIDIAYGEVLVETTAAGEDSTAGDKHGRKLVRIVEDEQRRNGTSGLVVSFQVPASVLMTDPELSVALVVQAEPSITSSVAAVLGPKMHLFSSRVDDERYVHVVARSPFHPESSDSDSASAVLQAAASSGDESSRSDMRQTPGDQARVKITVDDKHEKVASMIVRVDVVNAEARDALANGAAVQMALASGCTVRVLWEKHTHVHAFPLPVDIERTRIRVARRSSYIEVVAPVATAMLSHSMRFPVFLTEHGPALWNMPRVLLDKIPLLELPNDDRVSRWVVPSTHSMFSPRESAILDGLQSADNDTHRAFLDVKNALHTIVSGSVRIPNPTVDGIPGVGHRTAPMVYGLGNPWEVRCATLVFVTGVRLDATAHAVIADAWVLTVTPEIFGRPPSRVSGLGRGLRDLAYELVQLNTDAREARVWKHLLPAAVERCRTWTHKASCEYRARGVIPLTMEDDADPICSCGRGVGAGEQAPFQVGGRWRAFAPYVTRAALSPLYATMYMENGIGAAAFGGGNARTEDASVCWACGEPRRGKQTLQVCSKCRVAKYCSGMCQRRDWGKHKWACPILKESI